MVRLFALLSLAYAVPNALGQAIDNVLVEIYHVEAQLEGPPLATYRIFIDLAEGYELQRVYGDERNQLELSTTTTFFNDTSNGAAFGDRIDADRLDLYPLALDSWLTIGAASDGHWAIPRSSDPDVSILSCSSYGDRSATGIRSGRVPAPLCTNDGLVARDKVAGVVEFRMPTGYVKNIRGSVIHTMDGAWAVLGGTPGITPDNVVLVAQLSTTGSLKYQLNVQVRTPEKRVLRCVSTEAGPTDEVRVEALRGTAQWQP
jgi:hypothetical protein